MTKSGLWNRELDVLHYKWEFLRRNENFLREYAPTNKFISKLKIPKTKQFMNISLLPLEEQEQLIKKMFGSFEELVKNLEPLLALCERWEMPGFIDPDMSFKTFAYAVIDPGTFLEKGYNKKINTYLSFYSISMITGYKNSYLGKSDIFPVILEFSKHGKKYQKTRKDIIHLALNLNYPKSVILGFVEFYIERYQQTYLDTVKEDRARFDKYDTYLKIFDLKTNTKMDFYDVGMEVFPERERKVLGDSFIKTTERYYKSCTKLISGDYKKIR